MNSKHTPTPWELSKCDFADVNTADSELLATAYPMVARGDDEGYANAEFIVRACNAHDALVDALQGALADDLLPLHSAEWIAKARAALAAAGVV